MKTTKTLYLISLLFLFSCNVIHSQGIRISNIDYEDTVHVDEYQLHGMELEIPINEEYRFVKIKNITKVMNEKNENLVYIAAPVDSTDEFQKQLMHEFPSQKYFSIDRKNAILRFLFKSSPNRNIKQVSGNLAYIKKNRNTEIIGDLGIALNKNILPESAPFKAFQVDKAYVIEYLKREKIKEAKNKGISVEELEKSRKVLIDTFGPQDIQFLDNQLLLFIPGDREKILFIKFFDENDKEVILSENYNGMQEENELIAFNFEEKPNKNWKVKIYYEDANSIAIIPFDITNK